MFRGFRSISLSFAAGAVALAFLAGECRAAINLTGHYVHLTQPQATGDGGAFNVYDSGTTQGVSGSDPMIFKTFCLEYSEHIALSTDYKVDDWTTVTAIKGGTDQGGWYGFNGTTPGDPSPTGSDTLSVGTSWVYQHFLADYGIGPSSEIGPTLSSVILAGGSHFVVGDVNWSMALQGVIWRLEDEVNNNYSGVLDGNATAKGYANSLYNYVTGISGWRDNVGSGNFVTVMNLSENGVLKQSQLAYNPNGSYARLDPPPETPEPTSIVIWGVGLGLAVCANRYRRRKTA